MGCIGSIHTAAGVTYLAQMVTSEVGVPVAVTWTPFGWVGYAVPTPENESEEPSR